MLDYLVNLAWNYRDLSILFAKPIAKKVTDKVWHACQSMRHTEGRNGFVLGYYIPWLIFARTLDESSISENPLLITDIYTLESYIFESANILKLDIDRDYVYNIGPNALIEKYSILRKLTGKNAMQFNLGCELSESILLFNDSESREESINQAEKYARELDLNKTVIDKFFTNLRVETNREAFNEQIEEFAVKFVKESI